MKCVILVKNKKINIIFYEVYMFFMYNKYQINI